MRRLALPLLCLVVLFAAAYSRPGHTQNRRNAAQRVKPTPTPKADENVLDLLPDEDYGVSTTAPPAPKFRYISDDKETLRGLNGVLVVVEKLNPSAERDGLTAEQLRVDTELRLRKAGVRVLSQKECAMDERSPYLYVAVNLRTERAPLEGAYIFSISVELLQEVYLRGNAYAKTHATTWSTESVGSVGQHNLRQVREAVGNYVDIFLNDYLAVNPK